MYQRQHRFTIWIRLLIVAIFVVLSFGCKESSVKPVENSRAVTSQNLPKSPQRIVSLAPNITEILFAVGLGERVVAVTRFCDFPSSVTALPKVGGLIDPDVENIASHRPDLVIGVTSGGDPAIIKSLEKLKISYAFVDMESLEDTLEGIEYVAAIAGNKDQGAKLRAEMTQTIQKFQKYPKRMERRVLVVFGHKPLVGAGPGTFAQDMLEILGATNVLAENSQRYPVLDVETVMKLNPDRILDFNMANESENREFWAPFQSIEAVHSGNVFTIDDASLMRPGPRLVESLQTLALLVHGKHTHSHP